MLPSPPSSSSCSARSNRGPWSLPPAAVALGLAVALAACGGDDDGAAATTTTGSTTTGAGGNGAHACEATPAAGVDDVSGLWAYYEVTSRVVVAPGFAEPFHTRVVSVLLVDQTQSGDEVTFDAQYCQHFTEDPDAAVHVVIPDAYTASLPAFSRNGTFAADGATRRYELPAFYTVEGAQLDDAAKDPLPTDAAAPEVVDQDADGKPGMTLRLTGLVDGEIYVVQRGFTAASGAAESADEIRGPIEFESEQVILASDPTSLKDLATQATTDTTPCASFFRMKRLDAGSDCAFVTASFDQLFP